MIALAATAVAALVLFAVSLTGLAGIDGRLAAVSAERSPTIQVSNGEERSRDGRDCPSHERRRPADRVRS